MGNDLRATVHRDRATLADSTTFELSLKGLRALSAIDLGIRADNGATSNLGVPPHLDVDTIEVVDGSKVIYSLSGVQALALNCYELKRHPPLTRTEAAAGVQEEWFRLHFGRRLGDVDYWLDPDTMSNPMLRVTVSLTISGTVGFATGTGTITVITHSWDAKPGSRRGTLVTKQYKSYTSAASGDDRADLPADLPMRMLLIRALEAAIAYSTSLTQVKVTLDADVLVALNVRSVVLRDLNAHWFGKFEIPQRLLRADNATPSTFLAFPEKVDLDPEVDLTICHAEALTAEQVTLGLYLLSATPTIAKQTTAGNIRALASGLGPYNTLAIPFGDMDNPDSWFDPKRFKKFEAVLTQGDAGAAVSLFGQQVMS